MDVISRSVRAGDASSKEPDFIQDWPEIFQREIGKFLEKVQAYAFTKARYPGVCKRIGRQVDKSRGTSWEAFFHNREIGYHRNDYEIPARARVFIHVPRTGGTSAMEYFHRIQAPRILNAHAHHPISLVHPPGRHRYFTILRDPVERCWSFFRFTLHGKGGTPYRRAAERGLESFCDHCWEMRNMYCRYFSGIPWKEPDGETLAEASRQLAAFEAVLDFRDLDRQIHQLAARWGLRGAGFAHCNRAPGPVMELDAASREILQNYNHLDLQLHEQYARGFIRGFESAPASAESPTSKEGSSLGSQDGLVLLPEAG